MDKKNYLLYLVLLIFLNGFSQKKQNFDLEFSFSGTKHHKIYIKKSEKGTMMIVSIPDTIQYLSKNQAAELDRLFKDKTDTLGNKISKLLGNNIKFIKDTVAIQPGN